MIRLSLLATVFATLDLTGVVHGQTLWNISLKHGLRYESVVLDSVTETTLRTLTDSGSVEILFKDIHLLRRHRRSNVVQASVIGALAGGGLGYAAGVHWIDARPPILAVGGMVLGGIVGYAVSNPDPHSDRIDLYISTDTQKREILTKLVDSGRR